MPMERGPDRLIGQLSGQLSGHAHQRWASRVLRTIVRVRLRRSVFRGSVAARQADILPQCLQVVPLYRQNQVQFEAGFIIESKIEQLICLNIRYC